MVPVHGKFYDYTGFPKKGRTDFYKKIKKEIEQEGFQVADLTNHEYDPYFLKDTLHLGWKGWVYVDQGEKVGAKESRNNEFKISNGVYKKFKPKLKKLKGHNKKMNYAESVEFHDFHLMMDVLKESGAEPLFICLLSALFKAELDQDKVALSLLTPPAKAYQSILEKKDIYYSMVEGDGPKRTISQDVKNKSWDELKQMGQLKGKKIVFIISPQWFQKHGSDEAHFAPNFSALQAYDLVFNQNVDSGLKKKIIKRMLKFHAVKNDVGMYLQGKALEDPKYLPIFGSSELSRLDAFHPSNYFKVNNQGFTPYLVGKGGSQSLIHAINFAAQSVMEHAKSNHKAAE
ncbi:hypothetical protein DT075_01770 [Bacillus licheniformis]|nr:hypothetical protein DT075_01770 [Bacillus licheniformis]